MELALDEICEFINGGPWSDSEYSDFGIRVVKVSNMEDARIVPRNDDNYLPESKYEEYKKHELRTDDIVVATVGSHPTQQGSVVGRTSLIPVNYSGSFLNQNAVCVRVKRLDLCSQRYLFYLSKTVLFKHHIESRARGSANQVRMAVGELKKFKADFPCVSVQRKIAAILSGFDQLIENNQRRIALLEKMAEEIYREWFVRLRFPGHQSARKLKGLPENWSIRTLGSLCKKVTDGAHASPSLFDGGNPMASVKDMHEHGFDLEKVKKISDKDFESLKKADCQPLKNDVLIAKDGSYLKHVFVWDHDYEIVILSSIAILRPNLEQILPYFFAQLLKQDSTKAMMSGYVSGSALPRIILKDFKKMGLLVPTFDLITAFEEIATPIYKQIRLANQQIDQLKHQRDLLLPRLISGKLSVENLDIRFPPSMTEELNEESLTIAYA